MVTEIGQKGSSSLCPSNWRSTWCLADPHTRSQNLLTCIVVSFLCLVALCEWECWWWLFLATNATVSTSRELMLHKQCGFILINISLLIYMLFSALYRKNNKRIEELCAFFFFVRNRVFEARDSTTISFFSLPGFISKVISLVQFLLLSLAAHNYRCFG